MTLADRDKLREEWRIAAEKTVAAKDKAARARDGKPIKFDMLVNELMAADPKLSSAAAERMARTSNAFREYCRMMHDLRRAAGMAELEEKDLEKKYWLSINVDANKRAEMKMTR